MKLIVGLGNIGEKYEGTRHNVGFMYVDNLSQKLNLKFELNKSLQAEIAKGKDVILVKPTTFMNSSGDAVLAVSLFFKMSMSDLYVVHDDLDIKLGEYKLQRGVGPRVHNGIASIEEKLGKKDFYRIRIGVDNRDPENRTVGEAYVLQTFLHEELTVLAGVLEGITKAEFPVLGSK